MPDTTQTETISKLFFKINACTNLTVCLILTKKVLIRLSHLQEHYLRINKSMDAENKGKFTRRQKPESIR